MLEHEFALLQKLDHPNVIKVHEYKQQKKLLSPANSCMVDFIVMEYHEKGDAFDGVLRGTTNRQEIAKGLVSAVKYIHSKGIYHRDIKLENVVVKCDGSACLVDFGLASTEVLSSTRCGTHYYCAPEMFTVGVVEN